MTHKRCLSYHDSQTCMLTCICTQDTQDDAFNMMAYTHYAAQVVSASQQPCTHVLTCITQDTHHDGSAMFNTGTMDSSMLFPGNTAQQVSSLHPLCMRILTSITQDTCDGGGTMFNTGTMDSSMLFPGNTAQQVSSLHPLCTRILTSITQNTRDGGGAGAVFNTGTADRSMLFPGNTLQQVSFAATLHVCPYLSIPSNTVPACPKPPFWPQSRRDTTRASLPSCIGLGLAPAPQLWTGLEAASTTRVGPVRVRPS